MLHEGMMIRVQKSYHYNRPAMGVRYRYRVSGDDLSLKDLAGLKHFKFVYSSNMSLEDIKKVELMWKHKLKGSI